MIKNTALIFYAKANYLLRLLKIEKQFKYLNAHLKKMEKERKRTLNSLRKAFAESESDESFNESDFDDPEPFFIITSNHTINDIFDTSETDAIKRRFCSYCFDNDLEKSIKSFI